MQPDVAAHVQKKAELSGNEILPEDVWHVFNDEFINRCDFLSLKKIKTELFDTGKVKSEITVDYNNQTHQLSAIGNGPIDASKKALEPLFASISIESYAEHSLSKGSDSNAICYITITYNESTCHGVGIDTNITLSSVKALVSAINRAIALERQT